MNTENNEERLRQVSPVEREDRAMSDRAIVEDRSLTDEDRIELFRMNSFQSILPDIPPIPGYHVCWVSTTSQNDTIMYRKRLGYEPITRADIPGWDFDMNSLKTGEYAGHIGINEMLAFKIKESLYQAYMKEAHNDAPARQDEKLIQNVDQINAQAKEAKTYVQSFDGQEDVRTSSDKRTSRFE